MRFAYRLDQAPWTDSVDRNISVSGLGPGRHRLEVRCWVRDGRLLPRNRSSGVPSWNRCGERLGGLVCWRLACVLAGIIQFVRWRLSAAAKKQAELEAIVAARTTNLSEANRSLDDKARQLRRQRRSPEECRAACTCRSLGLGY